MVIGTAYCDRYRVWQKRLGIWMRQVHRGGEKAFVDYSGKRPSFIEPATGERTDVEFFVGVLGASSLTDAEATLTQRVPDFVGAHARMFEYFDGVPQLVVPDQLKSAVTVPSRSAPVIQRTYADLGRHYGTAIVPARPRKPRDKAKVEVAVQIAQRWILARLRNETFFSLQSLNVRIRELVELNLRPMKRMGGKTRRELFESLDRSALRALPAELLKEADLRIANACIEDVDASAQRGIDKGLLRQLATRAWIDQNQNTLITGATGTGKSYLACALGQTACRRGLRVLYRRMPRLLDELALAKADGSYTKTLRKLARAQLLIVDDFGLGHPSDAQRHDLLEVFEDRYGARATVITSQLPRESWHEWIGDETLADAILDRLAHNAYKIDLKGPSRRNTKD